MASLSSSSVSGSNSLGNTSLRGFGGLASGIDRDAIIEQMTLSTNTKIESQKSNMTKLQWKQEAYRGVTDKILDLTDKYASYSSTSNLKDPFLFSKSLVTVHGAEAATRFVTATGTSKLVENVAITAVKQLATATVLQSKQHNVDSLETDKILFNGGSTPTSTLKGTFLSIGTYSYDKGAMKFNESWKFKFDSTYTDRDGKKQEVHYTGSTPEELVKELNAMAESQGVSDQISFELGSDNKIQLKTLKNPGGGDAPVISGNSTALKALGYEGSSKVINMDDFNKGVQKPLEEASVSNDNIIDTLAGQSLIFEYDGNQKSVQLITKAEVDELKRLGKEEGAEEQIKQIVSNIQGRLDNAFGKGNVTVGSLPEGDSKDGYKLTFSTKDDGHTISILSSNGDLLNTLGIEFGESNKVNVDGKLGQAALNLDANTYTKANGQLDLVINGVSITGLTANSTISDILSKINSTTAAGVKATYVDATGQFMLVTNETGAGRDITLDSALSEALFGGGVTKGDELLAYKKDANGNIETNADGSFATEVIATKYADGVFKLKDGNGYVDEYGRHLAVGKNDDGSEKIYKDIFVAEDPTKKPDGAVGVNAAGNFVNKDGHLLDEKGQLVNKNGNLVALDENGNDRLIAVIDKTTGKAVDPSEYTITNLTMDENGNLTGTGFTNPNYEVKLINQNGHFVDKDNHLVDKDGHQVDENGYRLDDDRKYYLDENGKKIAYHKATDSWYHINEDDNFITEDGTAVAYDSDTKKWYMVDDDGFYMDATGQKIAKSDEKDADGNPIWYRVTDGYFSNADGTKKYVMSNEKNEDGSAVWYEVKDGFFSDGEHRLINGKDKDGKEVWYRVDETGHFIDKENYRIVKEKNEAGEEVWYRVGKNGFYLDEDGKEVKKDEDGNWYRVHANGAFVEEADGSKVLAAGNVPVESERETGTRATGKPEKGERVEVTAEPAKQAQVSLQDGTMASDGPITTGVASGAVKKIDGLAQNISKGQNAVIQVSYGNSVTVDMERASNTFNLEGLTVTVTGTFGGEYAKNEDGSFKLDADGKKIWNEDSSQTVTFSAKADVDKALETVKAFFEDFNALVTEINSQITARPDSNYGPLTSAQKEEMDETSIENWEKKAKQGILFGDDVMRDLSGSMEGVLSKLMMNYGVNYQDLEKIGITYSEDYLDGGTLVFDESKFRSAMESDPELVSKLISGGESGGKGLIHVVEDSLTPYATRYASKNGNSYGRLVEVAGTEKKPTTLMSNQIYKQLKEMQETVDKLQAQLKVEQDRYISQFTTMESLLNQMNTQSSYLSQLMA